MRYAFAGDRALSCSILKFLISKGHLPHALLVSSKKIQSHAQELKSLVSLDEDLIFEGTEFKTPENVDKLVSLQLDYIIGVHFPYIIPKEILAIPRVGFINLHPAFLPFNKGWNTPTWAIIDNTPYGATLHFMSDELDGGDIIHQLPLEVKQWETANSLYKRALELELQVFKEAYESLLSLNPPRKPQLKKGTSYSKKDLTTIQQINLNEKVYAGELLKKLRALTTNKNEEAAYFELEDKKFHVKVEIKQI